MRKEIIPMENFYFEVTFYIDEEHSNETEQGFLSATDVHAAINQLYDYYGNDLIKFSLMPLEDGLLIMPKEICEAYLKEEY